MNPETPPVWMTALEDQHVMTMKDMLADVAAYYKAIIPTEHYSILSSAVEAGLEVAYDRSTEEEQQNEVLWYRKVTALVIADRIKELDGE